MTREKELDLVRQKIKSYIQDADCGIFDTRNLVGDYMDNIFKGKWFTLDICYGYAYFEIFGTTKNEFEILKNYYEELGGI